MTQRTQYSTSKKMMMPYEKAKRTTSSEGRVTKTSGMNDPGAIGSLKASIRMVHVHSAHANAIPITVP